MTNDELEMYMHDELAMDTADGLERDTMGDLVMRMIKDWKMAPLYDLATILTLNYVEDFEVKPIQLIITPKLCLLLADALIEEARRIAAEAPHSGSRPN